MKKISKSKIISIITTCTICNKITTKKYFQDGFYLCNECNNLHDMEKISLLHNTIKKMKNINEDELNSMLDELINKIYPEE